jgi:hypothetical protein
MSSFQRCLDDSIPIPVAPDMTFLLKGVETHELMNWIEVGQLSHPWAS